METRFNEAALLQRLQTLTPWGQLAFLLSITERLIPNYIAFQAHHHWGELEVLLHALELGWRHLAGQVAPRGELEAWLERCDQVTPHTADFQDGYISPGLDAACCCEYVLRFLLEGKPSHVADAASLARDTVDMHVQDLEDFSSRDPQLEEKILQHPLMQRELQRQREDLDLLAPMTPSPSAVEQLTRRWRNPAVSNIDLRREPA
jgi:uncharacterized protein